jgi:hypothetical protein
MGPAPPAPVACGIRASTSPLPIVDRTEWERTQQQLREHTVQRSTMKIAACVAIVLELAMERQDLLEAPFAIVPVATEKLARDDRVR